MRTSSGVLKLSPIDLNEPINYEGPTDEEEREFWIEEGEVTFFVLNNNSDCFEIKVENISGCAQGLDTSIGLEYAFKIGTLGLYKSEFSEGRRYTIKGISVTHIPADLWLSNELALYTYSELITHKTLFETISYKLTRNYRG